MYKTGSDLDKAHRSELRFQKSYASNVNTAIFKLWDSPIQTFLLNASQLQIEEVPIFAYYRDQDTWLLSTSRRVLWSRPGCRHQLKYSEIQSWEFSISPIWLYFLDNSGIRHDALKGTGPAVAVSDITRFMIKLEKIHTVEKP